MSLCCDSELMLRKDNSFISITYFSRKRFR